MNDQTPIADMITLEVKDAHAVFTTSDPKTAAAPTLAKVRAIIDAWECPDVSTLAGRKEIASMAYRIAKAKSAIEKIGKEIADEAKALPKKIDATRRHFETTLDAWRDEVRKPLSDYEIAEDARITAHSHKLQFLADVATGSAGVFAAVLRDKIAKVEAIDPAQGEEFAGEIEIAKAAALTNLRAALAAREKADADAAELEALRKENAERVRLERERVIAEEAATAAAKREREAAEARERQLKADKEAAEQRAVEAAARAKADLEAKARAEEEEARKREANTAHRRKVNKDVVAALIVFAGLKEADAKAVVTAIAKGQISYASIAY